MREDVPSPLYHSVITATALAVNSLDSAIQKKVVQLASEIRDFRKRSLNLGNEIPPGEILGEMEGIIAQWWGCTYLTSSF